MAKELKELALADIAPASILHDKKVQDAAESIDAQNNSLAENAARLDFYSRIKEQTEPWLDTIARQWHADIYEPLTLTEEQKRYVVENVLMVHRYKGTRFAISTALKTLGFKHINFFEHWQFNGVPYTFRIKISPMTEDMTEFAKRFIYAYKPARSQLESFIFGLPLEDKEEEKEEFREGRNWAMQDIYPWPALCYDNRNLYSDPNNPFVPCYGDADDADRLALRFRSVFVETLWAKIHYSDDDVNYDAKQVYGVDNEENENAYIKPITCLQETEYAEARVCQKFKWIM